VIIILDPEIEFLLCIFHVVEGVQVNAFVFQGTPQPLDKDIVHPATFAVHRGFDVVRREFADPIRAGELRSLIGVEDRGATVFLKRLLQRLNTKVGLQGIRQPPGHDVSTSP